MKEKQDLGRQRWGKEGQRRTHIQKDRAIMDSVSVY